MVLGKLSVPGRPTFWVIVGQRPIAFAVGAGWGYVWIFILPSIFLPSFSLSPSLWETAQYRLKYCLKGPLNPKQPINKTQCTRNCTLKNTKEIATVFFWSTLKCEKEFELIIARLVCWLVGRLFWA